MAVLNGKVYYISGYAGGGYYLNRWGSGAVSNHQNVTLYTRTPDPDQQWKMKGVSGGFQILSMLNNAYGLNIYPPNNNNCDLYPVAGNENDAKILPVPLNSSQNIYRLKLVNYDYYLTAASNSSGANVYWAASQGIDSAAQQWKFEDVSPSGGTGNYLTYPCKVMRITQNYSDTYSHSKNSTGSPADYPIDEGCEDTGRSYMYCPCDSMVVKRVYGLNGGTNTIWLQSTSKVKMPCGEDYVTMMVLHPNNDTLNGITAGKTYTRGQAMFLEGNDDADAYHFHISLGRGTFQGNGWTLNSKGNYVINTSGGAIKPEQGFYIDRSFTTVMSTGGLNFQYKP